MSMTIFDNEYVINSSQSMNYREHLFNISLEADAKPGDYRLQVSEIHSNTVERGKSLFSIYHDHMTK